MARHNDRPLDIDMATQEGGELDFSTFLKGTAHDVKGYVAAQKRYLILYASDRAARLLSKALASIVLCVSLVCALLFLNVALALYLGEMVGSRPLGFLLVAALYLLLLGIFRLWWANGGRDGFMLNRINDLTDNDDVQEPGGLPR